MTGYWIRHRALLSIILSAVIAVIAGLLFVFPFVSQIADNYNSQSVYKNTSIDFIAPEPSFEQIIELPGSNGIDKVFPFFLTKTAVNAGGKTRTTTVLLSDRFENTDITMYNSKRLIKKSDSDFDNPILVDWQFCKDTSTDIGDAVSFSIGDTTAEYKIYAIYETNSIYENGAIIAQLSTEQKEAIVQKSQNNGYSGMYYPQSFALVVSGMPAHEGSVFRRGLQHLSGRFRGIFRHGREPPHAVFVDAGGDTAYVGADIGQHVPGQQDHAAGTVVLSAQFGMDSGSKQGLARRQQIFKHLSTPFSQGRSL